MKKIDLWRVAEKAFIAIFKIFFLIFSAFHCSLVLKSWIEWVVQYWLESNFSNRQNQCFFLFVLVGVGPWTASRANSSSQEPRLRQRVSVLFLRTGVLHAESFAGKSLFISEQNSPSFCDSRQTASNIRTYIFWGVIRQIVGLINWRFFGGYRVKSKFFRNSRSPLRFAWMVFKLGLVVSLTQKNSE